jgi:hypothetical protein
VLDELDSARAFERNRPCIVGARVIDDDDAVHEARNALERRTDQLCLVVGRHDDSDSLTFQHVHAVAIVSGSAGQGLARCACRA